MTVAELIEALKCLNPEYEVLVDGYEGGYGPIKTVAPISIMRDVNKEWWYGPHERVGDYERSHYKGLVSEAVVISR